MRKNKFFRRIGFDSPQLKLSGYDGASLIISEHINFFNNYRIQTKTKLTPPKSEISLLLKIKFSANRAVFVLYAQYGKVHFRTVFFYYSSGYPFGFILCQRHESAHICSRLRSAFQPSSS